MAVNPDTSTALPVLRDRMLGRPLLGKAVEDVNAVGHADADDQRQRHDVRQIERNPNQPMNPASQSVPMPTGSSDKITAPRLRKWISTIRQSPPSEYHAA